MLTERFEPFTLLDDQQGAVDFRGVLSCTIRGEIGPGETIPVLLYELDVTLQPGDQVRRGRDGAIFCVTDGLRGAYPGLGFLQAPVERLVNVC